MATGDQRAPMTSETKFTPGPWDVVIRGERGTFHIPAAQKHEAIASETDGVDGYTVSKANARLIAAAPDMLAALQAIIECDNNADFSGLCDKDWGYEESCPTSSGQLRRAVSAATDAIRKATTGQPGSPVQNDPSNGG